MTCSDLWQTLPAWGTAPHARFWVALEQNGSWGAKALLESDLDPELGRQLSELAAGAGGQALLVRDPLAHAAGSGTGRRVLLAGGTADNPWLGATTLADPAELLPLLQAWVGSGDEAMPGWLQPEGPLLLVCTNGKRDQCCAVKGRPLAKQLAAEFPGRVWESSHLHGHRFATTALVLPSSQLVARLDAELGRRLLREGSPLPLGQDHDRGRTLLPAPLQVAEAFVRDQLPAEDCSSLDLVGPDAEGVVVVTNRSDGTRHTLRVGQQTLGLRLPKSCGKEAEPVEVWQVEAV